MDSDITNCICGDASVNFTWITDVTIYCQFDLLLSSSNTPLDYLPKKSNAVLCWLCVPAEKQWKLCLQLAKQRWLLRNRVRYRFIPNCSCQAITESIRAEMSSTHPNEVWYRSRPRVAHCSPRRHSNNISIDIKTRVLKSQSSTKFLVERCSDLFILAMCAHDWATQYHAKNRI